MSAPTKKINATPKRKGITVTREGVDITPRTAVRGLTQDSANKDVLAETAKHRESRDKEALKRLHDTKGSNGKTALENKITGTKSYISKVKKEIESTDGHVKETNRRILRNEEAHLSRLTDAQLEHTVQDAKGARPTVPPKPTVAPKAIVKSEQHAPVIEESHLNRFANKFGRNKAKIAKIGGVGGGAGLIGLLGTAGLGTAGAAVIEKEMEKDRAEDDGKPKRRQAPRRINTRQPNIVINNHIQNLQALKKKKHEKK